MVFLALSVILCGFGFFAGVSSSLLLQRLRLLGYDLLLLDGFLIIAVFLASVIVSFLLALVVLRLIAGFLRGLGLLLGVAVVIVADCRGVLLSGLAPVFGCLLLLLLALLELLRLLLVGLDVVCGIVVFLVALVVGAVLLLLLGGLVLLGYGGFLLSALVLLRGVAFVGLRCLLVVVWFLRGLLPFGF